MSEEITYWALDLSIDLLDCNLDKFNINDIKSFGQEMGEFLDQGKWLSTEVAKFGEGEELMEGFRLVSYTHACLITGHFVASSKKAYINIFSCQPYKPSEAIELCGDFFDTVTYECKKNMRS